MDQHFLEKEGAVDFEKDGAAEGGTNVRKESKKQCNGGSSIAYFRIHYDFRGRKPDNGDGR